jgi:transcriptional regulator with XRE-family HTH domain
MITALQIRAARHALRWSASELAQRSDVAVRTIKRLEQYEGVPPSHAGTLEKIRLTLEAAGIEFIGTPEDGPGIRLRR